MKIAILTAAPKSYATRSIIDAGEAMGHVMLPLDPAQLVLMVSDSPRGYDRLYDTYGVSRFDRITISKLDAIIPRLGKNMPYALSILEHLTTNMGIWSTQSVRGISNARDKLKTLQLCSAAGIRTPKTIFAHSPKRVEMLLEKLGGLPVIAKLLVGSQGAGVSILETPSTAKSVIETYFKSGAPFLLQEYIEGKGKDIRAIVLGDKVVGAMERTAPSREFRANLSLGAEGNAIELTDEEEALCVSAAHAVGLRVAGVDLIRGPEGKPYLIEVNSNFGFQIQKISGIDFGAGIIDYVEKEYNSENNDLCEADQELLATLKAVQAAGKAMEARCAELEKSVAALVEDPFIRIRPVNCVSDFIITISTASSAPISLAAIHQGAGCCVPGSV